MRNWELHWIQMSQEYPGLDFDHASFFNKNCRGRDAGYPAPLPRQKKDFHMGLWHIHIKNMGDHIGQLGIHLEEVGDQIEQLVRPYKKIKLPREP